MKYYRIISGHGPQSRYKKINVPVELCKALQIGLGTQVCLEQRDSSSFVVGIVGRS